MNTTTGTRRPLNVGYLVVGLIFLGLAATWLLNETGVIDPDGFQWVLPAVLLGAGLIGLFASLGKGLSRRTRNQPNDSADGVEPEAADRYTYDDTRPVLDLTSDLDRKLAEHERSGEQQ